MFRVPLAPLHASLVALSQLRGERDVDRFTFELDPSRSLLQCSVSTELGACTLRASAGDGLCGSVQLALQPGSFPHSHGQELGGRIACEGRMTGSLPDGASGRPPRLELALDSLVIEPHSRPFVADGHGHFLLGSSLTIRSGKLLLRPVEGVVVVLPLAGITSRESRALGAVWIDADGIHLARELAIAFTVNAPELGLELELEVGGILRGDMALRLSRPAAGDSGELPELLESVEDAAAEQELEPEATLSAVQGLLLHLLGADRRGADSLVLRIPVPALARLLLPGPGWSLQLGYRDRPASLTS